MTKSWASSDHARRTMVANRNRDTKPELELRRALHAKGFRYRVCIRPLPKFARSVDIVFRPTRVAVEVHGCFWHGCPEHYRPPSANREYWESKVERNIARDEATQAALEEAGWVLIVVWEHEDMQAATARVAHAINRRRPQPT